MKPRLLLTLHEGQATARAGGAEKSLLEENERRARRCWGGVRDRQRGREEEGEGRDRG